MSAPEDLTTSELIALATAVALEDASQESEERWALVSELHRRGDLETFYAGVVWCTSDQVLLRCLGADVMGQLGYDQGHPFARECEPILSGLLNDHEPPVVACALIALGHVNLGDTIAIAELARHSDARVRYAAAFCLGARQTPEATEALITLSADDDANVRDWATFGLGSLNDGDSPAIREALVARLGDPDHEVRGEAMVGLAKRGDVRGVTAVVAELGRTGSVLAVEAAGEYGDPMFIPLLERLKQENPDDLGLSAALERCRSSARQAGQ